MKMFKYIIAVMLIFTNISAFCANPASPARFLHQMVYGTLFDRETEKAEKLLKELIQATSAVKDQESARKSILDIEIADDALVKPLIEGALLMNREIHSKGLDTLQEGREVLLELAEKFDLENMEIIINIKKIKAKKIAEEAKKIAEEKHAKETVAKVLTELMQITSSVKDQESARKSILDIERVDTLISINLPDEIKQELYEASIETKKVLLKLAKKFNLEDIDIIKIKNQIKETESDKSNIGICKSFFII